MSLEQLQIKIGADVSGVISNVAKADNSIGQLTHSLDDLQQKLKAKQNLLITEKDIGKIHQYQNDIVALKGRIQEVSKITIGGTVVNSLNKIPKASNEAANSLNNLSRIAQDAPFGFIGISNNINPMLESFQRLKTQTGSTGAALKSMATGLMGAGGLGLAVGIVSSLLVVFGDKLFKSGDAAETQAEKIKKAKQALDDYIEGLSAVDNARVKGQQSAEGELTHLQALYTATQNANIPIATRKKLVDDLQTQYPAYFGNINKEIILAGGAKDAYDKLTNAIIAVATAKAFEESITEKKKEQIALEREHKDKLVDLKKAEDAFVKSQQAAEKFAEKSAPGAVSVSSLQRSVGESDEQKKFNKEIKLTGEHQEKINKNLREQVDLRNELNKTIKESQGQALIDPGTKIETPKVDKGNAEKENKELEKLLQEKKDILLEFVKDFETIKIPFPDLSKPLEDFNATELTGELRDKLTKALLSIAPIKYKVPLDVVGVDLKKDKLPALQMPVDIQAKIANADQIAKDAQKRADDLKKIFEDAFIQISTEGFAGIGEAIGAALSGSDIGNVFKAFESMLGGAVQQLGKQIIALNVAAFAAKKALKLTFANPAIGIAAGIALVAVGAALKNLASGGIKGFAQGGWVKGHGNGDTVPAMLTPGEFVVTKDKAPFIASLLKNMGGLKLPKMINSSYHFADGGLVPNVRSTNVNRINVAPVAMDFPQYLPSVSISYDHFRVIYKRAFKQQNVFGG